MNVDKDLIYRLFNSIIVLSVILFVIYSCNPGAAEIDPAKYNAERNVKEGPVAIPEKVEKEPAFVITYKIDSMLTQATVDSFKSKYSSEHQHLIFALNRVDARRLNKGDVLVVPDTLTGNLKDYSPFPENLDILDSVPQAVLISQRIQAFALYEKSKLVKWGPLSSGKKSTPTPNGLFYGNYKARKKVSTINPDWLMPYYFNFMNFEGVGVHEYSMPGYPASHACVRLRKEDAMYVYDWARQWELTPDGNSVMRNGTPFMVYGEYDFDKPSPWLNLAKDHEDNFLKTEEKDTLKAYVRSYFKDERNFAKPENEENKLLLPPVNELETIE